jgi:hypothetical protein
VKLWTDQQQELYEMGTRELYWLFLTREVHKNNSETEVFVPYCAPCSTRVCLDMWGRIVCDTLVGFQLYILMHSKL